MEPRLEPRQEENASVATDEESPPEEAEGVAGHATPRRGMIAEPSRGGEGRGLLPEGPSLKVIAAVADGPGARLPSRSVSRN